MSEYEKGGAMVVLQKRRVSIYVDNLSQRWIVRDPDGTFWILPARENAWEYREPFILTQECDLTPVPEHYKYLLELPF
ncbi:MAG TPA: hypothetical protein VHB77_10685 [Planctomycetaceae bacterium]|nr:hypothetical protein [Planctomycetaceae bacterium]